MTLNLSKKILAPVKLSKGLFFIVGFYVFYSTIFCIQLLGTILFSVTQSNYELSSALFCAQLLTTNLWAGTPNI
nr:MAG TPA: hypothetical protein [Caudoviricetes sp.]